MKKIFKLFLYTIIMFITLTVLSYKNSIIEIETEADFKLSAPSCFDYGLNLISATSADASTDVIEMSSKKNLGNSNDGFHQGKQRTTQFKSYWCNITKIYIALEENDAGTVCENFMEVGKTYDGITIPSGQQIDLTYVLGGPGEQNKGEGWYRLVTRVYRKTNYSCDGPEEQKAPENKETNIKFDNKAPQPVNKKMNFSIQNGNLVVTQTFKELDTNWDAGGITTSVKIGSKTLSNVERTIVGKTITLTIPNYDKRYDYKVTMNVPDKLGNVLSGYSNTFPKFVKVTDDSGKETEEETQEEVKVENGVVNNGNLVTLGESDTPLADGFEFIIGKAKVDCEEDSSLMSLIDDFWNIILIAAPILTIAMGMIEFVKVVVSSDADAMKKAGSNTVRRAIALFLLMIIKVILAVILNIAGINICF